LEIPSLNSILELFEIYKNLIIWIGSISIFIFIFSLFSVRWLVTLIPSSYFIEKKSSHLRSRNPVVWYAVIILKNLIGYSLVLGGIMMLVLPGQGIFTIFIGLIMSNYPGKYAIEKKFIAVPSILKSINWMRARSNKLPIRLK